MHSEGENGFGDVLTNKKNNNGVHNGVNGWMKDCQNNVLVTSSGYENVPISLIKRKIQPPSPMFDRYPPKAFGALKVFPITTPDRDEPKKSFDELKKEEQEGLDEILLICSEYEKQNQTPTHMIGSSSPIVQNRIKTNGSLPRDIKAKSPNGVAIAFEFPEVVKKRVSEYENVDRKGLNLSLENCGYDNVSSKKQQTVPQSPRTRIRTCAPSPKQPAPTLSEPPPDKAAEYDAIIKSFEEKLKVEIQLLQDKKQEVPQVNESTLEERQKERNEVVRQIRRLKTMINDLESQEEEVQREMDVEKALVHAELQTEDAILKEFQKESVRVQSNLHRAEAQRNSNRVMQETNQYKLRQGIDVKQEHVKRLENLLESEPENEELLKQKEKIFEELENDRKVFEDLEFQYLEEETEWLQQRDEMQREVKKLSRIIEDKETHIVKLKKHDTESQKSACLDTKSIEKQIFNLLKELEVSRERLKLIDREIFEISGHEFERSDTDDEHGDAKKRNGMSQSLFGEDAFNRPASDLMSKSMNESLLAGNLELGKPIEFSTPKKEFNVSDEISNLLKTQGEKLKQADGVRRHQQPLFRRSNENVSDPLLKLKYNLVPDDHEAAAVATKKPNLNLSLEDDNFKFDPMEKRTPSQDDLDRISKITSNSPLVHLDASDKVKESIREIEKNRQLLLAQQGSNLIDFEKRKVQELKRRSQDEAKANYLRQFNSLPRPIRVELKLSPPTTRSNGNNNLNKDSAVVSYLKYQQSERPLSEVNSECSFEDNLSEKGANSHGPKGHSTPESNHKADHRNSLQSENSSEGVVVRRNIAKHQRPLTRYMPIFTDLNLREHIESAGHQISLCPHVFVDRTTCKGYLHKIGNYFGWSKRWFVLDREKRAFIYYTDKSEKKARGGAYFTAIDEVYLDHLNVSKSHRPHSTFIVKTKKRLYHLQAPSDAAARIWIDAIITGAQGNLNEFYDY